MPHRLFLLVLLVAALHGCRIERLSIPKDTEGDAWLFGTEAPAGPGEDGKVVFAAIGDTGKAGIEHATIARSVHRACAGRCDFVVLLGDNLYEKGVRSEADEQRLACLVSRYPSDAKYLVLGNHDYDPFSPLLSRARRELAWIRADAGRRAGARGGNHFYRFRAGPARMVAIDTNYLVRGTIDERYNELARWLGPLRPGPGEWVIVFGHHPLASHGAHGHAGSFRDAGRHIWRGRFFQHFMQQHVVGRADLYLSGHDHNLQFFSELDGAATAQLVSGSGSKCKARSPHASGHATLERYGYGFALVEVEPERLAVAFYDYAGRRIWAAARTRADPRWQPLDGFAAQHADIEDRCAEERAAMRRAPEDAIQACE